MTARVLAGMRITAALMDEILNPPDAVLRQTVVSSVGSSPTVVTMGVADIDTEGGWSAGNPNRYTCQLAGVYQLSGEVSFDQNGTGTRGLVIRVNGSTYVRGSAALIPGSSSTVVTAAGAPRDWYLDVGDYVELLAQQSSGGALSTFLNADQASVLNIRRVRGSAT
ncbi:hypothetical protein OG216_26020 [Streptomycetaceae bacterium NBC_01309]